MMLYTKPLFISSLLLTSSLLILLSGSYMIFVVWLAVLVGAYLRLKNRFVNLLILIEFVAMIRVVLRRVFVSNYGGALAFVFILMTLRVGEAVLGLSLLVRLVRKGSKDYLRTK